MMPPGVEEATSRPVIAMKPLLPAAGGVAAALAAAAAKVVVEAPVTVTPEAPLVPA